MNWDDLRYFLAVARAGSLSAAGRTLGVSQPTVSRRLAAMEARTERPPVRPYREPLCPHPGR